MEKKKTYESPDIAKTQVELESAICAGSVEFNNDAESKVEIEGQGVANDITTNDFSSSSWEVNN